MKSEVVKAIAGKLGLAHIEITMSESDPSDFLGLPIGEDLSIRGALNEAIDAVVEERIANNPCPTVFRFPHADGRFLVVTQNPDDSTKSSTHFEDADGNRLDGNLSTHIHADFEEKVNSGQYSG